MYIPELILHIIRHIIVLLFYTFNAHANTSNKDDKVCSGFGKWTKEGEFKIIRSNCITEKEYQANLNAKNYLCNYYQKSIWKESEREYGKKQYKWSAGSLDKIKSLKDQGKSLCEGLGYRNELLSPGRLEYRGSLGNPLSLYEVQLGSSN